METTESSSVAKAKSPALAKLFWCFLGLALVLAIAFILLVWTAHPKPPLQLPLADGRVLQIEGITFGKKHSIGEPAVFYEHFRPWLPNGLRRWLEPKHPRSTFALDRPALVVWVNALDPRGCTNIDCQAIRTEFVDRYGQSFRADTSSWFGGQTFWRVGHVFYVYPRDESQLNFRVVPWRTNFPSNIKIPNPNPVRAVQWTGKPLQQTKTVGDIEFELTQLTLHTNGESKNYWESPAAFWQRFLKFRRDSK
jgi:hypothetical protein